MKLRENRLMLYWLFWVAICFAGMIIAYFERGWFLVNQGDPTKISFGIVGIFFIGLAINGRNMLRINRELKKVHQIRGIFHQAYAANLPLNFRQMLGEVKKVDKDGASPIADHVLNLHKMAVQQKNGDVNQGNLVEAMYVELENPDNWTRYIATILASLGFLGTLVGFLISMNGLDVLMGQDKTTAILGLKMAIRGMGTAFYTTLVGVIFGALFLELLHRLVSNGINEIIVNVTKIGEVYIIPQLKSEKFDTGGGINASPP